jgi:elongation factor P
LNPKKLAEPEQQQEQAQMIKATQLRPGMIIVHDGQLYTVFSVDHRTPGNKRAAMATKMRNLKTGTIIDYRFRAEEFLERAIVDEIEYQYMYSDGEGHHFMNTQDYEQMTLSPEVLGEAAYYLIGDMNVHVEFYEGKPIGVALPDTVDLKVVDTEPTLQKATASAVMKPAKLETGLTINVPPFINNGDKIKVDTTEARYIQRA